MRPTCPRLIVALIALAALWLAGCGFHLRGEANYAFASLYLNSAAPPPFTNEMKRALTGAGSAAHWPAESALTATRKQRRSKGKTSATKNATAL